MPPPLSKPMVNGGARHTANQVGAGAPLPALLSASDPRRPPPARRSHSTNHRGRHRGGTEGQGLPAKGRAERAEERRWEGPAA